MFKKGLIFLLLFLLIVSITGCTTKTAPNGTFGEKTISIKNLTIVNNVTTSYYENNGTNFYYIRGYMKNNNNYDAFNVKMKAIVYDKDGNMLDVNDTVYLNPKVVPAGGESFFGFRFNDSDNRIVKYELQIISATAEP